MQRILGSLALLTIFILSGYSQKSLQVVQARSIGVNIRDNGILTGNAWAISPDEKLDIYKTSGKRVTFYTDIDSISFNVDPSVGEYNFVILLNGKDSAFTQIKYVAGFVQPKGPTAAEVRNAIENSVYALKVPPENVYKIVNKTVLNGTDSIKIRIYFPSDNQKQHIIFNIHGGAFVSCNLETHDNICRIVANRTKSIVIALDYRKPPEHPYPASVDDCAVVLEWIKKHASGMGSDKRDITLMGDSGGGLLVTELAIKLQGKLNTRAIVLINPVVDLRDYEQSYYATVMGWYLNDKSPNDSLVSPLSASNFAFFPPTLIITSEHDLLKPQGLAFYNKLISQGVMAKTVDLPNQRHLAEFWCAGHSSAGKAIEESSDFINHIPNK